jgi:hydrogenase small subunit
MDEPPGAKLSTRSIGVYGNMIRRLRSITNHTLNKEPKWRHTGATLTTGYTPRVGTPQQANAPSGGATSGASART